MIDVWLALALCFAIVAMIIIAYTRRVVERSLSDPFRSAESLTQGCFPGLWRKQIQRRLFLQRAIPWDHTDTLGGRLAIKNLDRLVTFFEKCPFFENEEARQVLLARLRQTRTYWQSMTWEEIIRETVDGNS